MQDWNRFIQGFNVYMRLEKDFSKHTQEAYQRDLQALISFLQERNYAISPKGLVLEHLQEYLQELTEMGLSAATQVRMLAGVRAFYRYLMLEQQITEDPTALLLRPDLGKHLPEVLSYEEVKNILAAIDLSTVQGIRNQAMIEVLYACGLRVSELVTLTLSQIHAADGFISVIGKGDKQRIVPIHAQALQTIAVYLSEARSLLQPKSHSETVLFLNRNGGQMTRQMVNHIVKTAALAAGIKKNVYPHIFRHSFASELVNNGADLRAVQEMLGHASITTTEIYTHLDDLHLRETLLLYHPFYTRE